MKNDLFAFLWDLPSDDWHWLEKFLDSPIYNQHEGVKTLFGFLKYRFQHRLSIPSKTQMLAQFSPPLSDARYHHLCSYLRKAIAAYLAWHEWQTSEFEHDIYLNRALARRNQPEALKRNLAKANKRLTTTTKKRNANYFRHRYLLEEQNFKWFAQQKRIRSFNLSELSQNHDLAFLTEKMKYACLLSSQQALTSAAVEQELLAVVYPYIESKPALLKHVALAAYYYGYRATAAQEETISTSAYRNMRALLESDGDQLTKEENTDLHLISINYCIRQINRSNFDYLTEVYQLYRSGIEKGYLLQNGVLSPFTYNNTVIAGLKLEKFEEIYAFIHEYREVLPEESADNGFSMALAKYHFERGDYERAMPLLSQMSYDDPLHVLAAKTMMTKIYVEHREFDVLESHLHSFRNYLRRKGILSYHRENYRNFIRLTKKAAQSTQTAKSNDALRQEIQDTQVLTEKAWLLRYLTKNN